MGLNKIMIPQLPKKSLDKFYCEKCTTCRTLPIL
jgi:hypothetical protein